MNKKTLKYIIFCFMGLTLLLPGITKLLADNNGTDFEDFTIGNHIDGQSGWSAMGASGQGSNCPFDEAVVANTYGISSFGTKSLRVSDAVACTSYNDQLFSASLQNEAGETSAGTSVYSGGVRQPYFEAQWDFASTQPNSEQPGAYLVVSADRGDSGRMTWLIIEDTPTGLRLQFEDYEQSQSNFVETPIATNLSRLVPHTIKMTISFVDGPSNDVVKIYLDGSLIWTGTTWEDYYRGGGDPGLLPFPVDSILFRVSTPSIPATAGNGFLIDNFSSYSGPIPSSNSSTVTVQTGNLGFTTTSSGQAAMPSGATNIALSDSTKLDLSANTSTISGSSISIDGTPQTISRITSGNLVNQNLSTANNVGGVSVQVSKAVTIQSGTNTTPINLTNSDLPNIDVTIPDGTTVLAPNSWDGKIQPAKSTSGSGATPTGYVVSNAIDVGSSGNVLLFDRPVSVVLSGVTGIIVYKSAGSDNWTQITSTCSGTYNSPAAPAFPGECSISNGTDTKIFTYHFTSFGSLVSAPPSSTPGRFFPLPVVNITKVASPIVLPEGPGPVTYTYTVTNGGVDPVYGVWVKDDKCSPVNFISGDTNKDSKLDVGEVWSYECKKIVSTTETGVATAHGASNGLDGYGTTNATVVVQSDNTGIAMNTTGNSSTQTNTSLYKFYNPLSLGSTGTDVTELQKRLSVLGVYSGPITGYYGILTTAGVKKYQGLHGISQVGSVGPITRSSLNSGL